MKSLADEALLIAVAVVVVVLVIQWAWHVVAGGLPLILIAGALYCGYRFLTGRRFF